MRTRRIVLFVTLLTAFSLLSWAVLPTAQFARAEDLPPQPVTRQHFNSYEALLANQGVSTPGESIYKNPPSPICDVTTSGDNKNTDCEGIAPHNETTTAVNPVNPQNMIGGANDYQLRVSSGGQIVETAYTRAHVTFDGGQTWAMYPIPYNNYVFTGDPAISFDANGQAYMATLGFTIPQGSGVGVMPDVLVSTSSDGGKTWSKPDRVATGTGSFLSPGRFNDKEYLTAWGDGNAIVTWTIFNQGPMGSYINSPIYDSVTHDGGATWSQPAMISGSASFCIGTSSGVCDMDQASTPVVAADGSIYVSFISQGAAPDYRDQYLVVKVDPATGQLAAGPFKVAGLIDGIYDYPVSIDGRQTYQDSEFRTWAVGNIAADPTNASHLAVAWSDMRNSTLPANPDPYQATTNSDVVVAQSFDGGMTWSAPVALTQPGDQFMPWAVYDTQGLLRIGYFDRAYDSANHQFGYTLATETQSGSLSFNTSQVTTTLSDPTQGNRWFSGVTVNPDFPHPTTFLGDYSGIAAMPSGGVVSLWTDLRNTVDFYGRTGWGQDAYFGMTS